MRQAVRVHDEGVQLVRKQLGGRRAIVHRECVHVLRLRHCQGCEVSAQHDFDQEPDPEHALL